MLKPTYTSSRKQNVPVHSNVRPVPIRRAAGCLVRATLLLIGGRRGGRRSAANVVQQYGASVTTVLVL